VKDASLYCPPGIEGVVVDAKVFSRKGADLDTRSRAILETQIEKLHRNLDDEKRILQDERAKRLAALLEARNCWPTCTTKRPTRNCWPRARRSRAKSSRK